MSTVLDKSILGFGKSPRRRTIYIGAAHGGLWYFWDGASSKALNIPESDLYCLVEGISIREGEYKNDPVFKMVLDVQGYEGERFRIVSGLETLFSRSVISNLLGIPNLAEPVSIIVRQGDDPKVVFGNVYQPGRADDLPILSEGELAAQIPIIAELIKESRCYPSLAEPVSFLVRQGDADSVGVSESAEQAPETVTPAKKARI